MSFGLSMFSKLYKRVLRPTFSTASPSTFLNSSRVLRDYEYVKLIEQSQPMEAYNLLIQSHLNNVVLDVQTFNTVYQKTKFLENSYHEVAFTIYSHYFKCSPAVQSLVSRLRPQDSSNKQVESNQKKTEAQTTCEFEHIQTQQQKLTAKTNSALENLLKVIRVAGQNRSNLVLNNVEIEFDYQYLFGNPLINQGIQQYGEEQSHPVVVDPYDILSCMKSIKIGQMQLISPESKVQI